MPIEWLRESTLGLWGAEELHTGTCRPKARLATSPHSVYRGVGKSFRQNSVFLFFGMLEFEPRILGMLGEPISTALYPQPHGVMFDCSPAWSSSYRLAKAKHTYLCPEDVSSNGYWILNITEEQTWPIQAPGGPESRNAASRKQEQQWNSEHHRNTSNWDLQGNNQNEVYICMDWLLSLNFHLCGSPHLWVLPLVGLRSINWNLSIQVMLGHRKPFIPIYVALCLYGIINIFWHSVYWMLDSKDLFTTLEQNQTPWVESQSASSWLCLACPNC